MDIAVSILCGLAFCVFLALNVRKSLHMFQLNSYKPATHLRWLRRNLMSLLPGAVVAVAAVAAAFAGGFVGAVVLTVVSAICTIAVRPQKAKKPLVYTQRVLRQILTLTCYCLFIESMPKIGLVPRGDQIFSPFGGI